MMISSYVTISSGGAILFSCRQGVVGLNENHISSDFFSDDLRATSGPKNRRVNGPKDDARAGDDDGLTGGAAPGSSGIIDLAVAKAIAGFELTMLVLTGRNITLVQRSSRE